MKTDIATPSKAYNEQFAGWQLPKDLLGGTRAMRAAAETWLPREDKESAPRYEARLKRSILFNGFRDTVNKISARPFAQPTTTDQDDKNVDRMGADLTQFAGNVFKEGLKYGRSHVLVNMPLNGGNNLATEGNPYFSLISPLALVDWTIGYDEEGIPKLTMIKYMESEDRLRVVNEQEWEMHEKGEDGEWTRTAGGAHTFGRVPIATFQVSDGFMTGEPPFEDLAWENLAHWQSNSDHRNILRFARIPMLYRTGFTADELAMPVEFGPSVVFSSLNPDAKAGFIENTGAAIEVGMKDLDMLEKHMEILGMQPLMRPLVEETATGRNIDNERTMSDAQKWAKILQVTLVECYKMAAEWKSDKGTDPTVTVFMDFGLSAGDAQLLTNAASAFLITQKTWIKEMQRRGILDDTVNPEEEVPDEDDNPLFGNTSDKDKDIPEK